MNDEEDVSKFRENVDSLFKLTHVAPLHTAIQALTFLFQIVQIEIQNKKTKKQKISTRVEKLQTRFYRALYERMMSKELWNSQSRLKIVLNLLFRAMKHDPEPKRVQAFSKRLLQTSMHGSSALECGALYLLSAVVNKKDLLRQEVVDDRDDDDDNEETKKKEEYDPKKRDPMYANADQTSVWELAMSQNHYHPSVRAFCSQIHENGKIKYNGDPLVDFSLRSFLNRFSYRNPKMAALEDGDDTRQHKSIDSSENVSKMAPVNSNAFLQQPVGRVRPDEMFFYRFFSEKARRDALRPDKNSSSKGNSASSVDVTTEQDEEEAFAQKLAESLMKDEGEEDEEIEFSMSSDEDEDEDDVMMMGGDDDDDDDEDYEMVHDEEESSENKKKRKKRQLYAAAEEFADVLENAGGSQEKNKKQTDWEDGKRSKKKNKKRRKR